MTRFRKKDLRKKEENKPILIFTVRFISFIMKMKKEQATKSGISISYAIGQ